jgi:hypothetical protein
MHLWVDRRGKIYALYGEAIDLATLGELAIRRASRVEPDRQGLWWADLSPLGGPTLGPFNWRSQALAAEVAWLEMHWPDFAD